MCFTAEGCPALTPSNQNKFAQQADKELLCENCNLKALTEGLLKSHISKWDLAHHTYSKGAKMVQWELVQEQDHGAQKY